MSDGTMEKPVNNPQPEGKPRRVRGTATFFSDDEFEFRPQQKGEPRNVNVRRAGSSQLYETTGERSPKLVAHLTIPKDSTDPAADLQLQLDRLTRPLAKKEPAEPRSRALLDTEELKVWHRRKEQKLVVSMTLDTANRPAAQMFRLMSQINKIIENKL